MTNELCLQQFAAYLKEEKHVSENTLHSYLRDIRQMADALLRLPDRERELLRMKYYEELSDREIARLLGINSGSVRTYLTRARRHLGDILKEAENHV